MQIPRQFTLFGNIIKVIINDIDTENRYGYWDDVANEIVIFKQVKVNKESRYLTQDQIEHTFLHEVIHAMQWYLVGDYNERDAQSFASLMLEFIKSSGIKINPNIVHEPLQSDVE